VEEVDSVYFSYFFYKYIYQYVIKFLDAFTKLRKATINLVVSIRPSAWNSLALSARIFMKDIWVFFEKRTVEKIQV